MTITVEYDSARAPHGFRARRSIAFPLYALALALSFLSDGLAILAAVIAGDPH
jgi:hypothetical protein